jgi:enterochelin esterase-like enzyme
MAIVISALAVCQLPPQRQERKAFRLPQKFQSRLVLFKWQPGLPPQEPTTDEPPPASQKSEAHASDAPLSGKGRVAFEGLLVSNLLGSERVIRVYLPASYDRCAERRYPVLYVHDGQNAFSTAGPHAAFGWGSWQLDATVDELAAAGKMREIILVAVDASAERYLEYRGPARVYSDEELNQAKRPPTAPGDNSRFQKYSRFLIEELKPKIDREYRTMADPAHTGVMGSSMGGIASLALAWDHPEIFGNAASLSGWYEAEDKNFLANVLRAHRGTTVESGTPLRPPKAIRVYLDSGTCDHIGGDDCQQETAAVAIELRRLGWRDGMDLQYFLDETPLGENDLERLGLSTQKCEEARRSQHNELYWRLRVWRPLSFMFPPPAE